MAAQVHRLRSQSYNSERTMLDRRLPRRAVPWASPWKRVTGPQASASADGSRLLQGHLNIREVNVVEYDPRDDHGGQEGAQQPEI